MATTESAKLNGAELLKELAATGTSAAKLHHPRQLLAFIFRKEKRVAKASELIDAMEKAGVMAPFDVWPPTPPLTLQKARALAATGRWDGPVEVIEVPVEEQILAGDLSDEPDPTPGEALAEKFDPKGDCTLETDLVLKPVSRGPGRPKKAPAPTPATV